MTVSYTEMIPMTDCVLGRILEAKTQATPHHPFLAWCGHNYTYDELNGRANQLARQLSNSGVTHGDRVAVLMDSSPNYLDLWFALAKLGAVEVPVNTAYKGEILRHLLASSGASTIVFDQHYHDVIAEVTDECPDLQRFVANCAEAAGNAGDAGSTSDVNGLTMGSISLQLGALYCGSADNLDIEVAHDDLACIMFTSGTTGPSKGVMINHHFMWSFGVNYAQIARIVAQDVSYNYLPFFHIAGKFVLMASMLVDARTVLIPRLSISAFWDDVRACEATLMVAVGGVCHMLNAAEPQANDADNALRQIYAVPAPAEFQDEFEARFGVEFVEGYGSTELNIVACSEPGISPLGSFGRAIDGYELDIFDHNDMPCAAGVAGEIVVRPNRPYTTLQGYYGLPERSLELMRNLWLHSGDQGYRDDNGWFFFLDRLSDSMRRRLRYAPSCKRTRSNWLRFAHSDRRCVKRRCCATASRTCRISWCHAISNFVMICRARR
jgi:crotonobetaine/carnitine-CoA ligase